MLELRPLTAGEEDLFLSLPDPALVGFQSVGRDYRELVGLRQYRPEWTWVALRDGVVVARAAWWGGPDDEAPVALDWLDFADGEDDAAVDLLNEAGIDAEYCLLVPPGWRADPRVRAAGEARIDVARRAGMALFVERLRYRWTPDNGLPDRPGRLEFRPEPDDDRVLDVLRHVVRGSLDAHEVRTREKDGVDAAARDELAFLRWLPSPREWWLLAYTGDGDLVGITVPGYNYSNPVIGFIGVVPEQRGHGYAYDLLVEATHVLVGEGVDRVVGETDTTNTPMAATFTRAGYPVTEERVYLK
jgi:ribosomal protein S18 acetylase RimI-like enzyme